MSGIMKRFNIILFLLFSSVVCLSAQNLRTGYFNDGYVYRYQFNPAFQGERGFVSMPAIGKVSLGVESNNALKNYIYPLENGKLGTFLHPSVSDDVFLKNITNRNMTNINLDLNLIAFGFRVKKSYHTVDLTVRSNVNATLPGELFRFLKVGASDGQTAYNFSKLATSVNAYAQLAYGYSHKINENLYVGGRVKFLLGLESMRLNVENLSLKLDQDEWSVAGEGTMYATPFVSSFISGTEAPTAKKILESLKKPSFGVAFDLGASYTFEEYFTVSASILDLGFISWNNSSIYGFSSTPWEFEGFENIQIGSESNNMNELLQDELNELKGLFKFNNPDLKKSHADLLAMTVMLGFEARMPFYDRLSFGVLGTQRIEGRHSWTEGRFSANVAPLRWISLSASYAISNFGHSMGAILNIHPKGFNLFCGFDSFVPIFKIAPNRIPINKLNTNFSLGINFPFGKYNGRIPKLQKKSK